jgi:hypothetical protein
MTESTKNRLGRLKAIRKRIRRLPSNEKTYNVRCKLWDEHWTLLVITFGVDGAYLERDRLQKASIFRYFVRYADEDSFGAFLLKPLCREAYRKAVKMGLRVT